MRKLTRNEAVLLGLLSQLDDAWTYRTKLVKLTYLLDNFAFEQGGLQLTTFSYVWDRYGPNAISNAIVGTLHALADAGLIIEHSSENDHGGVSHLYAFAPEGMKADELPLSADDWVLIAKLAQSWGRRPLQDVVTTSKATRPMRKAQQGAELRFESDPRIEKQRQRVRQVYADFCKSHTGEPSTMTFHDLGVRLEDVRAEVAE